ncbi:hypothetical protein TcasGA2_TC000284 [Tribolium castaneum]|uniref:Uncharacterized protein n=1 Tax=Tribolium castaneum TaxID=7070 RepID=D6WBC6_TRICA|nr:hypothetical protein TcasGA2_TC000284 [Tribolium castaneum]
MLAIDIRQVHEGNGLWAAVKTCRIKENRRRLPRIRIRWPRIHRSWRDKHSPPRDERQITNQGLTHQTAHHIKDFAK